MVLKRPVLILSTQPKPLIYVLLLLNDFYCVITPTRELLLHNGELLTELVPASTLWDARGGPAAELWAQGRHSGKRRERAQHKSLPGLAGWRGNTFSQNAPKR